MSAPFQPLNDRPDLLALWRKLKAFEGLQPLPATATLTEAVRRLNEILDRLQAITRR